MADMTETSREPLDPATLAHLQTWQGKSETLSDSIAAAPLHAVFDTLDRDDPATLPGTALPPLWH